MPTTSIPHFFAAALPPLATLRLHPAASHHTYSIFLVLGLSLLSLFCILLPSPALPVLPYLPLRIMVDTPLAD